MEHQLTLRISADLSERLDLAAARLARKRSDVVRLALEQFLSTQIETRPIEQVRDLLGRLDSGLPDLGQHHREYLIGRLRDGR